MSNLTADQQYFHHEWIALACELLDGEMTEHQALDTAYHLVAPLLQFAVEWDREAEQAKEEAERH